MQQPNIERQPPPPPPAPPEAAPCAVAAPARVPVALPRDAVTRDSLTYCHHIARKRARNFYYGLKLTPEPRRSAVYTLYAFMRACDDMVDAAEQDNVNDDRDSLARHRHNEAAARIETFRATMQSVLDAPDDAPLPGGPLWPAFRYVHRTWGLRSEYLHAMLDAQQTDLVKTRYETFDELYDYCYKVASVVGLVCIDIWGHDGASQVKQLAEHRGIALQLTNILRDVAEDAARGRVYLPIEDLERFGYTSEDLTAGRADERFDRLMRYQIERARSYYEMSSPLEPHLDAACRPTSWAMMRIYRGLLDRIAAHPRRVLTERIRLASSQKFRIAIQAAWKRSWCGGGA